MNEWHEYRIKDVARKVGSGTTPSSNVERFYNSDDYHWINTGDFNNSVVFKGKQMISQQAINEIKALRFYPIDTVLVAMYGASIGKVGILKVEATVNQACCAIIPNTTKVIPYFLFYLFINNKEELLKRSFGGTQPNVSQAIVSNLIFKYPSLDVQQRIVSYLDAETAKIDHAIELLKKKREAYTRLKASVINRVVTRGLNPNVKLKDSGVEWIGRIPEGWKLIPLKGNISIQKGKTPTELDFEGSGFPYLTMDYLRNRTDRNVMYPVNSEGLISIDANELLVLWDGANAGEFILSKQGYLGSTMAVINVNSRIYYKGFFYYLLKSIEPTSKYFSNGTTIPHFDSGFFYGRFYPAPSIKEQHAIASYLDTRCARIDKAAAIVDKQIDAYTRLKKSLINEVVTGKRRV